MEKEKDTYWKLIERLQSSEPTLNNPEALTERIMKQIEQPAAKQNVRRRFLLSGWLSGAAAILLICVFMIEWKVPKQELLPVRTEESLFVPNKYLDEKEMSLSSLIERRMESIQRRNALYNQLLQISSINVKTIMYENK